MRLLLLAPQALVRTSLAGFLASQPHLEVVSDCGTADEALDALQTASIDLVLLDFDQNTSVAEAFLSSARNQGYAGPVLILTSSAEADGMAHAIRLGASGIFLKSETPARLVQAIHLIAEGGVWLQQKILQDLADQFTTMGPNHRSSNSRGLTEREHKVLLGVLGGLTNRKIGDRLGVSEASVKASLQHLFSRTGVRTRSQLVRMALEGALGNLEDAGNRQSSG